MTYLLDINVLVALFDTAHIHHEPAHRWFAAVGAPSWATCPLTENGFIRVVTNPSYPTIRASPEEAALRLGAFCTEPGHQFWPETLSITDATIFDLSKLQGHRQLTDLYLAALAYRNAGKLATFDSHIPVRALIAARDVVELIPTS